MTARPAPDPASTRPPTMCLATALYHIFRRPTPTSPPPSPLKPRPTRLKALLLPAAIAALTLFALALTFSTTATFPTAALPTALLTRPTTPPTPTTPRCANALIFTGARQGSTWFIDSIERCAYSAAGDTAGVRKFATDVFKRTELWKHFGEAALNGIEMDADAALRYIVANTSVKIFPSVFWRRRKDVAKMLARRAEFNLTVLVLRRDVEAAWDSWSRAHASKVWNGAVRSAQFDVNETQHRFFVESRGRYDDAVEALLDGMGVKYDVFDYDRIRALPVIVARKSGCYIANCNFDHLGGEGGAAGPGGQRGAAIPHLDEAYQVEGIEEGAAGEDVRDRPE